MKKYSRFILTSLLLLSTYPLYSCNIETESKGFDDYKEDQYCRTNIDAISQSLFPAVAQIKPLTAYNKDENNNYIPLSEKVYPFDTNLIYTMYSKEKLISTKDVKAIENISGKYTALTHQLFDRHYYYLDENNNLINNLKVINDSYGSGEWIKVDNELFTMLKNACDLTKTTNGNFNIFIGELSDFWNGYITLNLARDYTKSFDPEQDETTKQALIDSLPNENQKEYVTNFLNIYSKEKLEQLKLNIPQAEDIDSVLEFDEENSKIKFNKYNNADKVSITLGGIAKGYLTENLYQKYKEKDLTHGVVYAGASSIVFMDNIYSQQKKFTLQLSNPYSAYDNYIGSISITEKYSLSTSGSQVNNYYAMVDGKPVLRQHIINGKTGYPSDNYHKITLISKNIPSTIMDSLSTVLVNCEENEIKNTIESLRNQYGDLECVLAKRKDPTIQNKEVDVYLTKGLQNSNIFTKVNNDDPSTFIPVNYHDLDY